MAVLCTEAQKRPPLSKQLIYLAGFSYPGNLVTLLTLLSHKCLIPDITSKCLGNVMRVDVGPLGGNLLKITAVMSKLEKLSVSFNFLHFSLLNSFSLLRQLCHSSHAKLSLTVWHQCEDRPARKRLDLRLTPELFRSQCGNEATDRIL